MLADDNPYAAPQATLTVLTRALPSAREHAGFPWVLVRRGLRNGAVAGVIATLAMLFVYLLPKDREPREAVTRLFMICGAFTLATSSLGLFWGFNHALIVWCLRHWSPETWMDD